jgi:hypothetical protein
MKYDTGHAGKRKWNAKWIWADGWTHETNVYYYFRKTFSLETAPEGCRLFLTADTRYQLFINGAFVGRGVPQSQPFYQYYDTYDLSDYLQKGENCIAAVVNYVGNLPDTRGGFLLELEDAGHQALVCSDATWRVIPARAWNPNTHYVAMNMATPYQEFFDAREEPVSWRELDFDDSAWPTSGIIGGRTSDRPPAAGPWTRLVARDIPFMTADPLFPLRVERVEENLDLRNRSRTNDLAPGLSMVGQPIQYTKVEQLENLCMEDGSTIVQCSTNHLDLDFDGIYAPTVVLDFGRVITARSNLCLDGIDGGIVEIGYAERLIDGHFNIAMECEFADRYTMKNGRQVFESFTWKSFRYLKLRFRSCDEPVTIHSVRGIVTTYPFTEQGRFNSSDATLNAVFKISRETLRLCSNEFIMDTPWREQAQWLGDVAQVTLPAIHTCFGDTALTRKFLMQSGQNQHPTGMISNVSNVVNKDWLGSIPDYSLWWIKGLHEQFLYTGDEDLLHRLYPQALRVLDAHLDYLNEDSLIEEMPYWHFVDWAHTDKRGICSAYNAIFHVAIHCLQSLATFRGDAYTVGLMQNLRMEMKKNFHRVLFDKTRNCYADANMDGVLSEKISEHGNMTPVWAGLCDDETSRQIIELVFETDSSPVFTEAQPFYMSVVLEALDRAGRMDLAIDLIRRRWGRRMVDKGATSVFEEWYQNGSWRTGSFTGFQRTHSHAWSACPADFLIRNLIGLKILEPGCRKLRVAPMRMDFDYHLVYPTLQGPITVECVGGEIKLDAPNSIELVSEVRN